MKVLVLHNYYRQRGGEDVVFESETRLLSSKGHRVIELVEMNQTIDTIHSLELGLRLFWSQPTNRLLRSIIATEQPDLLHIHNTFPLISPSAYYIGEQSNLPVIQTLHNYRLLCPAATFFRQGKVCTDCLTKTPPWPGVLHACYRESRSQTGAVAGMLTAHRCLRTYHNKVDRYIALTEFARRKFIEGGLPAEKIVVKPNFIHPDPGQGERRRGYALFVGRVSEEKGIWTLLRAWSRLAGHPLKIVGDGELRPQVEAYIDRENLQDIEVLGQRKHEDVIKMMKAARLLIFPSVCYEGFPVAIAEAFATGLPVAASQLGSMAEIIEDGRTGIHFEPGDEDELAEKVAWAWAHPRMLEEMGNEARLEYEKKYTAEINYQQLMKIYESAFSS